MSKLQYHLHFFLFSFLLFLKKKITSGVLTAGSEKRTIYNPVVALLTQDSVLYQLHVPIKTENFVENIKPGSYIFMTSQSICRLFRRYNCN
jgi:hypothetical protein